MQQRPHLQSENACGTALVHSGTALVQTENAYGTALVHSGTETPTGRSVSADGTVVVSHTTTPGGGYLDALRRAEEESASRGGGTPATAAAASPGSAYLAALASASASGALLSSAALHALTVACFRSNPFVVRHLCCAAACALCAAVCAASARLLPCGLRVRLFLDFSCVRCAYSCFSAARLCSCERGQRRRRLQRKGSITKLRLSITKPRLSPDSLIRGSCLCRRV